MEFNVAKFKEIATSNRLLYMEEDAVLQEQMMHVFSRFFTDIDLFDNGQEAYECFLENKHPIIVMDIVLKELDGVSVIRKIKDKGYDPIIIVLTAHPDVVHISSLINMKIDHFSMKPFKQKDLMVKIYDLLVLQAEDDSQGDGDTGDSGEEQVENILNVYNNLEEGILLIEGNTVLMANRKFLELSGFADFEAVKLELTDLSSLFVSYPESMDALDTKSFLQQVKQSKVSERSVIVEKNGHYLEYQLNAIPMKNSSQYILTFTEITGIVSKYKVSHVTQLPNGYSLREKLKIYNIETPEFYVVTTMVKHFDPFTQYYGKLAANDLERYVVERIEKALKDAGAYDQCYFAQFARNQFVIVSTSDIEYIMKYLHKIHLNEFRITSSSAVIDKEKIDIDPVFKFSKYESEENIEKIEIKILNDFDELSYSYM